MNVLMRLYVRWFARRLREDMPYVEVDLPASFPEGLFCATIMLKGTHREFGVELAVDRQVARDLGLGTPKDFVEEALVVNLRDADNRKEVRHVKQFNRQNLRWVGVARLKAFEPCLFRMPAQQLSAGFGWLEFSFQAGLGLGGTILGHSLPIGDGDPEAVAKYREYQRRRLENRARHES